MEDFNLPPKVRRAIYVLSALITPVMGYLNNEKVVSDFWFGLFTVVMTAVYALAAVNVSMKK